MVRRTDRPRAARLGTRALIASDVRYHAACVSGASRSSRGARDDSSIMTGRLRLAAAADARALAEVHVRGWRWGYRGLLPEAYLAALSVDARERGWRSRLADPGAADRTFVWDEAGAVRGFAWSGPARGAPPEPPEPPDHGKLHALYLDEELAGRGVGRTLHDAALEAMRAAGFTGALLWVLEDNARGRAFYARQGWAPDGARKDCPFGDVTRVELRLVRRL